MPGERPGGLFITGTDTGVGKTILSAALLAAMRAAGERVRAHKPVVTGVGGVGGVGEPAGAWPADHELLGLTAGMSPEEVAPRRFEQAVSPHLAAELAGEPLDPAGLIARARNASRGSATRASVSRDSNSGLAAQGSITPEDPPSGPIGHPILIIEGVGGMLVPLTSNFTIRDLAVELGLPLLIAARPGLGTINHTLLTLQSARAAGLDARAVVLTPWPDRPSAMERSNRETIEGIGEIEVATLPLISGPNPAELASAGATLPWRRWLEAS